MACESCKSIKEEKNLIFETKYWKIFLAENQYHLGRCYIDLKRHASLLSELKKRRDGRFFNGN